MDLLTAIRAEVTQSTVTGASGKNLSWYCDLRKILLSPLLYKACIAIYGKIHHLKFDCVITSGVGGTALLGGLLVFLLANTRGSVLRDTKKSHGLQKYIEGDLRHGDSVLIIDDVLTTGGSIQKMVKSTQDVGAIPIAAAVILDRSEGPVDLTIPIISVYKTGDIN